MIKRRHKDGEIVSSGRWFAWHPVTVFDGDEEYAVWFRFVLRVKRQVDMEQRYLSYTRQGRWIEKEYFFLDSYNKVQK